AGAGHRCDLRYRSGANADAGPDADGNDRPRQRELHGGVINSTIGWAGNIGLARADAGHQKPLLRQRSAAVRDYGVRLLQIAADNGYRRGGERPNSAGATRGVVLVLSATQ